MVIYQPVIIKSSGKYSPVIQSKTNMPDPEKTPVHNEVYLYNALALEVRIIAAEMTGLGLQDIPGVVFDLSGPQQEAENPDLPGAVPISVHFRDTQFGAYPDRITLHPDSVAAYASHFHQDADPQQNRINAAVLLAADMTVSVIRPDLALSWLQRRHLVTRLKDLVINRWNEKSAD